MTGPMTQEIYALAVDRKASTAEAFLEEFLPKRVAVADDYPVPAFSEHPTALFATAQQLMTYLELNPDEPYGIYWNATSGHSSNRQAMLFYTVDGCLIFGIAVQHNEAEIQLDRLVSYSGSGIGMFGSEERPPETACEFRVLARHD